eukprot:CAMPEP_0118940846 /NCGR_PEP_ID=MMETSP1169-20130426/32484_1 /TAXON_ID=36882 /ORGANISM="Pyramimonas obovata, Strain CCMP722" /LENGTH=147 /DNA_ID=CAMNT_0006885461 /DNA_START=292 /DNA_END=735 /DNA_ORIENTATION=+
MVAILVFVGRHVGGARKMLGAVARYPFIDFHDDPIGQRSLRKPGYGVTVSWPLDIQVTFFPVVRSRLARISMMLVLLLVCSLGMLIGIVGLSPFVLPVLFPLATDESIRRAIHAALLSCTGLILTSGAVLCHLVHSYEPADSIEHAL